MKDGVVGELMSEGRYCWVVRCLFLSKVSAIYMISYVLTTIVHTGKLFRGICHSKPSSY